MGGELLLTSDAGENSACSVAAWDPHSGTRVTSFRGATIATSTLSLLSDQALVAGERGRPVLQVWRLAQSDAVQRKQTLPAPACAMTVDSSATWCAVAAAERISVYHLSSGRLAASLSRHYQPVSCLRFTDDCAVLLSAGQDGLVLVWSLAACVDGSTDGGRSDVTPVHVWSDHALPVTGLHVGAGGVRARAISCSLDRSCRVYQLSTGRQLLCVSFECGLTAVVADPAETQVFVGTESGAVRRFSLREPPRCLEANFGGGEDEDSMPALRGHTAPVGTLSVSETGATVASGSSDGTVRVWDLNSGQCRLTLDHRGPVTSVMFFRPPPALVDASVAPPPLRLGQFQRQMADSGPLTLELQLDDRQVEGDHVDEDDFAEEELKRKLARCEAINSSLYSFMVGKITDGVL